MLKVMKPVTDFLTGAVKTSPSGMLNSPGHLIAGISFIEKERSVPPPLI